jgi:hypothetical protein
MLLSRMMEAFAGAVAKAIADTSALKRYNRHSSFDCAVVMNFLQPF